MYAGGVNFTLYVCISLYRLTPTKLRYYILFAYISAEVLCMINCWCIHMYVHVTIVSLIIPKSCTSAVRHQTESSFPLVSPCIRWQNSDSYIDVVHQIQSFPYSDAPSFSEAIIWNHMELSSPSYFEVHFPTGLPRKWC